MKAIVLLAVLACASAKPQFFYSGFPFGGVHYAAAPVTYAATPAVTYSAAPAPTVFAPAFTKTQYHAQDELGQASYGYSHPGHAHAAVRDAFGGVRGSYAYIGADGKEVRVNYVADSVNGFRAESNALPVAPSVPIVTPLVGPSPVQDTPEVVEARAAHFRAIAEAQARNAEAEKKDAANANAAEDKAPEAKAEGESDAEVIKSRRKRALLTTYASPLISTPTLTYSAPVVSYAHPTVTYAAHAPVVTYGHPLIYAAPAVVAAPAVRSATLTKVVNTPGHAVSYRVD